MNKRLSARQFEILLLVAAVPFLVIPGYRLARYALFQHCPTCLSPAWVTIGELHPSVNTAHPAPKSTEATGQVIGRLQVPRLHMSVVVLNGDDDGTLALGPGRIPGTALIGTHGNAVIAGHRDMAFRALRHIRIGDHVEFTSATTYRYVVKKLSIVKPDDLSVLQSGSSAELTMITCYPFRYVGNAPERFIVQAELVSTK